MENVRHIILVLSGKGGVGKSTVSSQLAMCLAAAGKRVGLLDVDLCGPSIPRLLGVENKAVHNASAGWVPVYTDASQRLAVMSIQFLLGERDAPVVWRGPKKVSIINRFVDEVCWGELDYLIIDTPPGTSDEHMAICEHVKKYNPDGAVIVTTPQQVSLEDVRKEITFCRKVELPILGVVENMSGYVCPHCSECTNIFSSEGGRLLAEETGISFLGKIPIDPSLGMCGENGLSFIQAHPDSQALATLQKFVKERIQTDDAKTKTTTTATSTPATTEAASSGV
eukprot:TRINITY_DN10787_c0_g1_i4.p1 TRINITY_DN10787_c0_g1~~TRINITY_DN10787_c0_g1_i4.p1  ORF type:complete len:282 (-),score=64.53 TRINITY_DN10787_c0_g1_i4:14-859(-)